MKPRRAQEHLGLFIRQPELARDAFGGAGHAPDMFFGLFIAVFGGAR